MPASETHTSSRLTPPTRNNAPNQSILTGRLMTGSFSVLPSTMKAITAIGTVTQKHQRHPSQGVSTMSPPTSGPLTVATAKVAPM